MEKQIIITDKRTYKLIVWGLIAIGLIANGIFYVMLQKNKIGTENLQIVGLLAISCITTGAGMGLAYARTFKIKEVDNG